jgi:hypothetical protein
VSPDLIFCFFVIGGFIIFALRPRPEEKDGEWRFHNDGEQMRRWHNGKWEIRPATRAEGKEWQDMNAW